MWYFKICFLVVILSDGKLAASWVLYTLVHLQFDCIVHQKGFLLFNYTYIFTTLNTVRIFNIHLQS